MPTETPKTDAIAHKGFCESEYISRMTDLCREFERENAKLLEERNAAIRMAWELVQELVLICKDPIHKQQHEELKRLRKEYILPNGQRNPAPKNRKTTKMSETSKIHFAKADDSPCSTFWVDAAVELPDDDMAVLVALDDGEVWTGFRDAGQWRYVSADLIEAGVTHWAEFPAPPALKCQKCGSEETWFDRTISYSPDGTEEGMKTRCAGCGQDIDESNASVSGPCPPDAAQLQHKLSGG